jgi:hypothetical protein
VEASAGELPSAPAPAVIPPEAPTAPTLSPEVQEKMRVLLTDILSLVTDITTDLGIVECNHREECPIYQDCRELAKKMRQFRAVIRTTQI